MKMSKGNSPDYIKLKMKTRANPPPGAYDALTLPSGDLIGQSGPPIKFNTNKRTSFLDEAMQAKMGVPAPGNYELKSSLVERTTKMARDKIDAAQGQDKFSAKRYPIWARPATQTPGPAGYNTDEYTRKEVLRRAQKSLPNLTKDMLRPGNQAAKE